jgi:type 1 fimbriae regulatory protein FimE
MKTLAKKPRRKTRPTLLNGTVPPKRALNRDVRPREYLTPKEVERLIAAAKKRGRRYGLRDATMILVAFRHGLRVSELCALTWDQIDFSQGMMHVRRIKNGIGSVQQIGGEEMRMLRALKREDGGSRYVFMTERGAPMTPAGFRKFLSRLAIGAKFQFLVHPHMLRHNAESRIMPSRLCISVVTSTLSRMHTALSLRLPRHQHWEVLMKKSLGCSGSPRRTPQGPLVPYLVALERLLHTQGCSYSPRGAHER